MGGGGVLLRDSGKGFCKWELQRGDGEERDLGGFGFFCFFFLIGLIL